MPEQMPDSFWLKPCPDVWFRVHALERDKRASRECCENFCAADRGECIPEGPVEYVRADRAELLRRALTKLEGK